MERKPGVFEWIPTPGQFVKWMLCTGLIVGLLVGLSTEGAGWGVAAGLLIGAPLGSFLVYAYNLSTKPVFNKESADEVQRQIHSIRRWMKPPEDR